MKSKLGVICYASISSKKQQVISLRDRGWSGAPHLAELHLSKDLGLGKLYPWQDRHRELERHNHCLPAFVSCLLASQAPAKGSMGIHAISFISIIHAPGLAFLPQKVCMRCGKNERMEL